MARTRSASSMAHLSELFHPQNASLMQQLLAHLRAVSQPDLMSHLAAVHPGPAPSPQLHGFGAGGAVIGDNTTPVPNAGGPMVPNVGGAPSLQGLGGLASPSPTGAGMLRGLGYGQQAASLWQQRHPAAMSGHAAIPPWVRAYLGGHGAATPGGQYIS